MIDTAIEEEGVKRCTHTKLICEECQKLCDKERIKDYISKSQELEENSLDHKKQG